MTEMIVSNPKIYFVGYTKEDIYKTVDIDSFFEDGVITPDQVRNTAVLAFVESKSIPETDKAIQEFEGICLSEGVIRIVGLFSPDEESDSAKLERIYRIRGFRIELFNGTKYIVKDI